jgi:hypothetical protein
MPTVDFSGKAKLTTRQPRGFRTSHGVEIVLMHTVDAHTGAGIKT